MSAMTEPSPGTNLAQLLADRAAERGWTGRPAFHAGEASYTHGELHDGVARAAGVLQAAGVRAGDHVLLVLPDTIEFVWAFLGSARLGAVAILVNPLLSEDEHAYVLADAAPAVVVCERELASRFAGAPVLRSDELAAWLPDAEPAPAHPVTPATPLYAQYTSGTTGRPKAALHGHADPAAFYQAMGVHALRLEPDDVLVSVSKAFFAYGLGNSVIFPLFAGASAVLWRDRPAPAGLAELVRRHRPTVLFAVPTFYAKLLDEGDREPFGCLRAAVSAGEALLAPLAERAEAWLGCPVLDGLGSTEVGQTFVSNTLERRLAGTIGMVLPPYEIEVRDEDGKPLADGSSGVLHVRGPSVLREYLNKPEATAAAFVEGWLRTGDLVRIDENGFVHHEGRVDDLEMVGGITMSPYEVEQLLATHEAVSEVAVAAVREANGASVLRAFVVPSAGHQGSASVERELQGLVRAHLAPYKVPRSVEFVPGLPRTPTGKLRRYLLREGAAPRS
ncbi:MAG: benzoate-CoA ligase family protein [Streptosporangiales bacterium]|nr:benzoate-CoA ligase family protein [Streptosporangiales bacterium]